MRIQLARSKQDGLGTEGHGNSASSRQLKADQTTQRSGIYLTGKDTIQLSVDANYNSRAHMVTPPQINRLNRSVTTDATRAIDQSGTGASRLINSGSQNKPFSSIQSGSFGSEPQKPMVSQ